MLSASCLLPVIAREGGGRGDWKGKEKSGSENPQEVSWRGIWTPPHPSFYLLSKLLR